MKPVLETFLNQTVVTNYVLLIMFSLIIDFSWPKNVENEKQLLSNR